MHLHQRKLSAINLPSTIRIFTNFNQVLVDLPRGLIDRFEIKMSVLQVDGFKIPPPKLVGVQQQQSHTQSLDPACGTSQNPWDGLGARTSNPRGRNVHEAILQKLSKVGGHHVTDFSNNKDDFAEFKNIVETMVRTCHLHSYICGIQEANKKSDFDRELEFILGKENLLEKKNQLTGASKVLELLQTQRESLLNRIHRGHKDDYLSVHAQEQEHLQTLLLNCLGIKQQLNQLCQYIDRYMSNSQTDKAGVQQRSGNTEKLFKALQNQIEEYQQRWNEWNKLQGVFDKLSLGDSNIDMEEG
eukprot:TRINITY_DN11448_c0_g1_i1.p1 TRINITY_DN11448_c0_g1~~TRINITY_DN11448_c0_g1_i1.p1  ORF type:complete len:300 (+),score=25.23 TRINITY_DN11448_c0_g1_i1:62-961(+)